MKIKNKTTGKVLEVMDGTNYAKTAYEVVGKPKPVEEKTNDKAEPKTDDKKK